MGHGAPKRISTIPQDSIVRILASEGLLYSTQRKLTAELKKAFGGDDSPEVWQEIDRLRKQAIFYSQQYTRGILSLQKEQERA